MNRRSFFVALAGAAAAGTSLLAASRSAEALPLAPLPATAPGMEIEKASHRHWHKCRKVWRHGRWVVVC